LKEVQGALGVCQSELSTKIQEFKDDVKREIRSLEDDFCGALEKKVNLTDFNNSLVLKADQSSLSFLVRVNEVEYLKNQIEKV
jgi:hypothetical protein